MWHDHDIDFARWLHPAMWHVTLESWQWFHQVAAPCNVIRGSGMTCHWIRRWQHPEMWQLAVGWHAMEFAQTSAILEFYIWLRFWPYHRTIQIEPNLAIQATETIKFDLIWFEKKMTSCRLSRRRISAIFDFRSPIMGFLKAHVRLRTGRQ